MQPAPWAAALTAAAARRACPDCGTPRPIVADTVTLPGFGGVRMKPCECKEKRDE